MMYQCVNKRCRDYHKRFPGVDPREHRAATGSSIRCHKCGSVCLMVLPQRA